MTDYTHEITLLQRARIDMQTEKAMTRTTIKAKYAERIRQEIDDANQAAELHFARLLAEAHAAGIPQSVLRSEVLRTNVWSRWVYWRDLAEIQPDRIVIHNAKQERDREKALAKSHFRWSEDFTTLTAIKTPTGQELEIPVVYDVTTNRMIDGYWWPDADSESAEREARKIGGRSAWSVQLHDEIQAQIDAGNITAPNEGE